MMSVLLTPVGWWGWVVVKATWKGTEVAVKVISASEERSLFKETQRAFREEVEVMTALRHPNVVLFMAACTKYADPFKRNRPNPIC